MLAVSRTFAVSPASKVELTLELIRSLRRVGSFFFFRLPVATVTDRVAFGLTGVL